MPGAHSRLSPSSAHRWRPCPAAPNEEEGLPDEAGIEAAYGTVFHEYAALSLELGLDPQVFVGAPYKDEEHGLLTFDQEMADTMLYGLDYVRDYAAEPGTIMYVEQQVDLSPWLGEEEFGTSDCCIINVPKRRIIVFDWKYGKGIPVSPLWNDQGILYGLGCWETFAKALFEGVDPTEIEVWIIIEQPRADGGGGIWYTTMDVLLREGKLIKRDAARTLDPDAPHHPGTKQCQFCKAAKFKTCKPHSEFILSAFDLKMDEVDDLIEVGGTPKLPKPRALTPERRSFILLNKALFTKFLEELHAEAYDDALKGRPVPDMKLVSGRAPPRSWKDDDKVKNKLVREFDDPYTKKLFSPAQAEERLGKRRFRETFGLYVTQGEPKPQLVPLTDRRDPLPDVESKFDALMDEDDLV